MRHPIEVRDGVWTLEEVNPWWPLPVFVTVCSGLIWLVGASFAPQFLSIGLGVWAVVSSLWVIGYFRHYHVAWRTVSVFPSSRRMVVQETVKGQTRVREYALGEVVRVRRLWAVKNKRFLTGVLMEDGQTVVLGHMSGLDREALVAYLRRVAVE